MTSSFGIRLCAQMIGLLFTLAGSGCALMAPSGMESTPAGMVPGQDALGQDMDLLYTCRFDPDAEQMSQEDFRPGKEVQVITVDRHVKKNWGTEKVCHTMTIYTGTVESVDSSSIVLKDVFRMFEARAERGVPILQSVPYLGRMFRNTGVGRTSDRMPDNVTIPRLKIGGAFELSPSGIEKLKHLRNSVDVGKTIYEPVDIVNADPFAESQTPL